MQTFSAVRHITGIKSVQWASVSQQICSDVQPAETGANVPVICVTTSTIPVTLCQIYHKKNEHNSHTLLEHTEKQNRVEDTPSNMVHFFQRQAWVLTSIGLGSSERTTPAISVILCNNHHQYTVQIITNQ
jgi:hypothetical protein